MAPLSPRAVAVNGGGSPTVKPMERNEITAIVQGVVMSLRGDLTANDLSVYQELEGLVRFIHSAKAEIAALRPDEIQQTHLPAATDELDAIVGATEEATGVILDAVEKIEAIAPQAPPEVAQELSNMVTRIYEACNFQDITGQRITKVVRTLKHIESKVAGLVMAFGDEMARANATTPEAEAEAPAAAGIVDEKDLLNGPQLPSNATSQADIDALFG